MSQALVINNGRLERVGASTAAEKLLLTEGAAGGLDIESAGILAIGGTSATATSVQIGVNGSGGLPVTIGEGGIGGSLTTVAGDLTVSGNEIVVGSTTFQGNTVIGLDTDETLEVKASVINSTAASAPVANTSLLFQAGSTHKLLPDTPAADSTAGSILQLIGGRGSNSGGVSQGGGGAAADVIAGAGGDGLGAQLGGDGGIASLTGGAGGAAGTGDSGGGGGVTIAGGDAGAGGTGANGGDVTIDAGAAAGGTDGTISIGTTTASSITIGASGVATSLWQSEVSGSAGDAVVLLNATGATSAGSYAIGVYDDPAWTNIGAPADGSLQAMFGAINTALAGAGTPSLDTVMTTGTPDNTVVLAAGAGVGEAISLTAGAGAVGAGANGFTGGAVVYVAGAGGANNGSTDDGGVGGAGTLASGAGGAATGAGRTGGAGGALAVTAGAGGNSASFGGGAGGDLNLSGGAGGTGTFQGAGGNTNIFSGDSNSSNGPAGDIIMLPGTGVSSDGDVRIIDDNTATDSSVTIGPNAGDFPTPTKFVSVALTGSMSMRNGPGVSSGNTLTVTTGFQNPNNITGPAISVSHTSTSTSTGAEAAVAIAGATGGSLTDPRYTLSLLQESSAEAGVAVDYGEMIRYRTAGTGAEEASFFLMNADPNTGTGVAEGELGSLGLDATNQVLYIKTGATTWTAFSTGGGVTDLQGAYTGGPDITQDATGGIEISKPDASGTGEYVLRLDDVDDATAANTMEINKSPTTAATAGEALDITVGTNSTGSGITITHAGDPAAGVLGIAQTGTSGISLAIVADTEDTDVISLDWTPASATSSGNALSVSGSSTAFSGGAGTGANPLVIIKESGTADEFLQFDHTGFDVGRATAAVYAFTATTQPTAATAGVGFSITGGQGATSGAGGAVSLVGGAGGTTDGAGGAISITGGAGGVTNSDGGDVTINAGALAGTGANGDINIGVTTAAAINIGLAGASGNPATVNHAHWRERRHQHWRDDCSGDQHRPGRCLWQSGDGQPCRGLRFGR
jgi:hypothetical protein